MSNKMSAETKSLRDDLIAVCDTGNDYLSRKMLENGCWQIDNLLKYSEKALRDALDTADRLAEIDTPSVEQVRQLEKAVGLAEAIDQQLPIVRMYHDAWMSAHSVFLKADWQAKTATERKGNVSARLAALRKAG